MQRRVKQSRFANEGKVERNGEERKNEKKTFRSIRKVRNK
jgi:hypothetical protein